MSSPSFFRNCTSNLKIYYSQYHSSVLLVSPGTQFWPLPQKTQPLPVFFPVFSPIVRLLPHPECHVIISEFRLKIFLFPVRNLSPFPNPPFCQPGDYPALLSQHPLNNSCYFTVFHPDCYLFLTHAIYIITKSFFSMPTAEKKYKFQYISLTRGLSRAAMCPRVPLSRADRDKPFFTPVAPS